MSIKSIRDGAKYRKARKRLDRQSSDVVNAWANSSIWSIQAATDEWNRSQSPDAATIILDGAIGLLAVGDILLDRSVQPGAS